MWDTFKQIFINEGIVVPWFIFYIFLELFLCAKPHDWKAVLNNVSYWPIWVIGNALVTYILAALGYSYLQNLIQTHQWVLELGGVNPILFLLTNLIIFDICYYWYHRTQHKTFLWRQHEVHHSDTCLNATTAFRHHFLENFIKIPFVDLPSMAVLVHNYHQGNVGVLTFLVYIFINHLGIFAHANLKIGFGKMNFLLVCPQTHRIHHSIEPKHWGKNFAAYFPFIDVAFGTFYNPHKEEYPETGVPGMGRALLTPKEYILHPFKIWWQDITLKTMSK